MRNRTNRKSVNRTHFVERFTAAVLVFAMAFLLMDRAVPAVEAAVKSPAVKSPAVPKSVQAYPAKSDSIKVTWKKVTGASGYQIYRSTKKSGGFKAIKKVGASKSSYTNTGLDVGTKYFYKVRAYTKKGGKTKWGSYSSVKSAVVGAKGLAAYGLKPNAQLGKKYAYKSYCWDDHSKMATGVVKFSKYKRVDTGDGYDRITLTVDFTFKDDNAKKYGLSYAYSVADYYLYKEGDKDADLYDGNHVGYTIEYNGEIYDDCSVTFREAGKGWANEIWSVSCVLDARVPNDYDGIVVWAASRKEGGVAKRLNSADNLLMFRCD